MDDAHPLELYCPACGARTSAVSEASGEPHAPTPGAVNLCLYCRSIGLYAVDELGELVIRDPTDEELLELVKDPYVRRAMAALAETHRLLGVPEPPR